MNFIFTDNVVYCIILQESKTNDKLYENSRNKHSYHFLKVSYDVCISTVAISYYLLFIMNWLQKSFIIFLTA
jgi:hypothetical protein